MSSFGCCHLFCRKDDTLKEKFLCKLYMAAENRSLGWKSGMEQLGNSRWDGTERKVGTGRGHGAMRQKLGLEEWEVRQLKTAQGDWDPTLLRTWQITAGKQKLEFGIDRIVVRLYCWIKKKPAVTAAETPEREKEKRLILRAPVAWKGIKFLTEAKEEKLGLQNARREKTERAVPGERTVKDRQEKGCSRHEVTLWLLTLATQTALGSLK